MPLLKPPSNRRRFNFFDVRFHTRDQSRRLPVNNSFIQRKGIKGFSVSRTKDWTYDDRIMGVSNPIMAHYIKEPHLVLSDRKGVPRSVLSYVFPKKGEICITTVQRLRTEYLPHFSNTAENRWSSVKENKSAREMRQDLGMHPSDVLASEFLHRFRRLISSGKLKVSLKVPQEERELYKILIKHFFSEKPVAGTKDTYVLSLKKRRTQEALSLN